jgi:polysaccharide export outer membrane protein
VNQFAQSWKSVSGDLRKGALIAHKVLNIQDLARILNGSRIAHSLAAINLVGVNYPSGVSTLLARNSQRVSLSGILILAWLFWGPVLYAQSSQSAPPTTQGSQITGSKSGESAPSSSKKRGKTPPTPTASASEDGNSSNDSGAAKTAATDDTYRIGIGDQLQISVWHERDLTLPVAVRPDGVITMPLLNDVYVVGQTPKELAALLTEKLKPFVNEPQVTVSVSQIQSRKVYLVGQVARQGAYPLNDGKTVFELISEAGGLGVFAKKKSIYVLRLVNGKPQKMPFHYNEVLSGQGGDITLLPGDRVVVP